MRALLRRVLGRCFGRGVGSGVRVGAAIEARRVDTASETAPLSYPSDEVVACILAAMEPGAPTEIGALQAVVDLSHEDFKSGAAALALEGMVDLVAARKSVGEHSRWPGLPSPARPQRPAAWISITPRGPRFLARLDIPTSSTPPAAPGQRSLPASHQPNKGPSQTGGIVA